MGIEDLRVSSGEEESDLRVGSRASRPNSRRCLASFLVTAGTRGREMTHGQATWLEEATLAQRDTLRVLGCLLDTCPVTAVVETDGRSLILLEAQRPGNCVELRATLARYNQRTMPAVES